MSLPALTLGTSAGGTFTAAEQENDYQVTVPAGGSLVVALGERRLVGVTGGFTSARGRCRPRTITRKRRTSPISPIRQSTVPQVLTAGTYYILVESVSGAAATAGYTLIATQTSAPDRFGLSPASGGNAGNVTLEIDGTNLAPADTASLTLGTTTIDASAIDFVNASQIYATFDLTGAAAGNYTLTRAARKPGGDGPDRLPGGGRHLRRR